LNAQGKKGKITNYARGRRGCWLLPKKGLFDARGKGRDAVRGREKKAGEGVNRKEQNLPGVPKKKDRNQ